MELRDWVQEKLGGSGRDSLLDESLYSSREVREDKKKLEQSIKQLENEMEQHSEKYQKLLQKGAEVDEMRRRQYAQKAKFEKKKYKVKKKKHKAQSIKLGTVISIEGAREIMEMQDDDEDFTNIGAIMQDDINAQEVQADIMDQMAKFGLDIEDMKQVQEALDIEILDDELEEGASEELEVIEEMAAGEVSREQIDIEEEVEIESDDLTVQSDIDDEVEMTDSV
jgi:hypothetical protein